MYCGQVGRIDDRKLSIIS